MGDLIFTGAEHQMLVADFTSLPFRDGSFSRIYFDPPHLIRNDVKHFNPSYFKFGNWPCRRDWETALDRVNVEFRRVIKPRGLLFVKIIDGKDRRVTKIADLNRLTSWDCIDLQIRPSSMGWSSCKTINAVFRPR